MSGPCAAAAGDPRLFDAKAFRSNERRAPSGEHGARSADRRAALVAALDSGRLAAPRSTWWRSSRSQDSGLLGRDNVILTPHTCLLSIEGALEELQTKCAADVARVLSGEKPVLSGQAGMTRTPPHGRARRVVLQRSLLAASPTKRDHHAGGGREKDIAGTRRRTGSRARRHPPAPREHDGAERPISIVA